MTIQGLKGLKYNVVHVHVASKNYVAMYMTLYLHALKVSHMHDQGRVIDE